MKLIKKTTITLSLVFALLFISSCGNDNYCIQKSSLRPEGFVLPNLFTALNYKDTFNLNDTLWIKLTIPAKFSANMKSCNLVDNQIEINNDMLVYRSDSVYHNIDDIQNGYIILGDIPRILTKQGSDYNSTFGLVLNNPKITFIGDTTTKYWPTTSQYIQLKSWIDKNCTYTDCKNPYESGFYIYTSFQGNKAFLPINIRH